MSPPKLQIDTVQHYAIYSKIIDEIRILQTQQKLLDMSMAFFKEKQAIEYTVVKDKVQKKLDE